MKKFLFLLFIFLIIPKNVLGLSISGTSITGEDSVYTMNKLPLKVRIDFDDYKNNGIAVISYEIKFNEYAFNIYDISTNDVWESKLYKYQNKYYVVSIINPGINNRCSDGLLYCYNYEADIVFYANDTSTIYKDEISIGDIEVGVLNTNYNNKVEEKDIVIIKETGNSIKEILIKKSDVLDSVVNSKIEINEAKPNVLSETKKVQSRKDTYVKSANNYIDDLIIEGYNLKFRQFINDYSLEVKKDVNKLDITVKLLSDKAKYKIIGNDNLKENNNEVKIEVTAENGDKNIYTIKVSYEKDEIIKGDKKEEEVKWYQNEYFKYGVIIVGSILIIILLVNIVIKIREHKIEKRLKDL